MNRLKKGDEVVVITGRDKGKRGTIINILAKENKLVIEGINTVKKHVKANPNAGDRGGIIIKSIPIQAANVMLYNPSTQKGSRIGIRVLEDGRKVRYFKSTNEVVDIQV